MVQDLVHGEECLFVGTIEGRCLKEEEMGRCLASEDEMV